MKKTVLSSILILSLCASLCSCGSTSTKPANSMVENATTKTTNDTTEETTKETTKETEPFPYVGTWVNEDKTLFLKIYEDNKIVMTAFLKSDITNRVTTITKLSDYLGYLRAHFKLVSSNLKDLEYEFEVGKDMPTLKVSEYTIESYGIFAVMVCAPYMAPEEQGLNN